MTTRVSSPLRRVVGLTIFVLALGACEADPSVRSVQGGPAIGVPAPWQPISPGDAEFSIVGDWTMVRNWSGRSIQTRVQSQVNLDNGWILSERPAGVRADMPPTRTLEVTFANDLGGLTGIGVPFEAGSPRTIRAQNVRIDYGVWRGPSRHCVGFRLLPETMREHFSNGEFYVAYARGIRCANAGTARGLNIEQETLELLQRVVFDRGAANRLRPTGTPPTPGQTPSSAPPRESAPLTPSAPPTRAAPTPPSPPAGQPSPQQPNQRDVETRLRELNRLRDSGLITPQEYEARRRAILEAL